MADIVQARERIVRDVRLVRISNLQRAILYRQSTIVNHTLRSAHEFVRAVHDREVGQRDLAGVARDDGRQAEVFRLHRVLGDLKLKVAC